MKKDLELLMLTATNIRILEQIKTKLPDWREDASLTDIVTTNEGTLYQMVLIKNFEE